MRTSYETHSATNTATLQYATGYEGGLDGSDAGDGLYARLDAPTHMYGDQAPKIREDLASRIDDLNEHGFNLVTFEAPQDILSELGLADLPEGVAIVGGAARAIFLNTVLGEAAMVRDVDLTIVEELGDTDIDEAALSHDYMPDDAAYGHGVQRTYLDAYFATRDFTMNEIMVVDGVIIATQQAIEDLQNNVIRPTEYEAEGWRYGIGPKLMIKALLQKVVLTEQYGQARCEGFEQYDVDDFYVALGLNKAFQYGMTTAQKFLRELGVGDVSPDAVIDYACELAESTEFTFRGSSIADMVAKALSLDEWGEDPDDEQWFYQPEMKRAIGLMGRYASRLPQGADFREY